MVLHEMVVALLPAEVALCTASWIMMLEYSCSRTSSEMNIDLDEGAHGVEMRRWVQVTLSLAALCRAIALGLDMLHTTPFTKNAEYPPYHAVADLLYILVYSFLTLFWAQLCLLAEGNRKRILRSIFTIGLSSFLLLFGATVIALASSSPSATLHNTLANMTLAELGAVNGIIGTLILYFGVRVIIFTQKHGRIAVRRPWALNCRTILLTLACNGACLLRCGTSLAFITGMIELKGDSHDADNWAHMYGVYVWVTDVVPTWVVFLLTVRRQGWKPYRFTTRDFRDSYRLPSYASQGLLRANSQSPFKEDTPNSSLPSSSYGTVSVGSNGHKGATASQESTGLNANQMPKDSRNDAFVLPIQ